MFIMMKKIFFHLAAILFLTNIACAGEVATAEVAGEVASAAAGAAVGVAKTVAPVVKSGVNKVISGFKCTAKKCGAGDAKTIQNCFMVGDKQIQDNPHCSNAYYNAFCKKSTGDETACENIKNALGLAG